MHREWSGRLVTVIVRQNDIYDDPRQRAQGIRTEYLRTHRQVRRGIQPLYGGIDTVQGAAIGAITYTSTGPAGKWSRSCRTRRTATSSISAPPRNPSTTQAVERAGHASPEDEPLMTMRIRTRYRAGGRCGHRQPNNGQDTPGRSPPVASEDANGARKETN